MLTFEALLVKELQKQQSRAEFCDIVLQTQGVSVPVHSCVLSAFSPWLCETLSAMPSPRNGQRRLIEVQAVEACTLLSLVSLLYSGQFNEDKEEVLLAACKLGINIPQRKAKRSATEQNTQTERSKEVAERECQTESVQTLPSECQNPKETIETVIGPPSWRSDQGLCTYADGSDITLATLQNVQGNPENMPSFQVMDVVPETAMYPTVSGPACLPQVYVCPPAASYQQAPTPLPTLPLPSHSTYVEPLANQDQARLGGEECVLEAFAEFENNIPGFINYFLDTNISQGAGQREQGQRGTRGDIKTVGRARRRRRVGLSEGFALKGEVLNICKREQNMNRCGRVVRSAWMGQGGGRVGRVLDTRQVFKNQERLKRRRQGRGVMKEEGEKGRSSSRARPRQRKTGSRSRLVEPVCQDTAPPPRRRRGRPRTRPLPQQNVSQNFSGTSAPKQKIINLPAPSLMHTASLPATNQTGLAQPMDWLIDDVIAQLPFMPNNQHGITNTVTVDSSVDNARAQSSVKFTDLGIVQPQSEGELTDILDSFLRTFEQHVGISDSDVQDGMLPNIIDASQTCGHTNTSNAHSTSMNTTTQGSKASLSKNRPQVSSVHNQVSQKPLGYWQVSGVTMEKSLAQQGEEKPKTGRITRSQSRKRQLEIFEEPPRRNELPAKRKRETKKERLEKPKVDASLPREKKGRNRKRHGEQKGTSCTVGSSCSVASALRKVINTANARNLKCATKTTSQKTLDGSKSSELHDRKESSIIKKKQMGHNKRNATKTLLEGSTLKEQCSTETSQPKWPITNNKTTVSRPALSAFELMKKILENQHNREEEQKGEDHTMRTVMKQKGVEQLTNMQVHGAEVKMTDNREKDGRIRVEEHNNSRINQKDEKTKERMKDAGNQMTICLQNTLPSVKDCSMSNGEILMENSYNKATLETADSPNDSPFQRCSTEGIMLKNRSDMPFVSHALDPTVPLENFRNTQGSTDGSEDEEVDVVEVSSSLSESFSVLPVTVDIVPSTEEEEDEDYEIDVISLGSN
ncbi:BTB/POZ domain-containing protein 18 [Anabarilius grahami]|uniref:BTB/POZ domain-containing protein 18 n=1 Tax=Anabarilius grahami TaxID=495550 RepID=A0A3N0YLV8_ANAGA|nr:BTB/POZ domain-containing protein 18 [Anabarilius grahami]